MLLRDNSRRLYPVINEPPTFHIVICIQIIKGSSGPTFSEAKNSSSASLIDKRTILAHKMNIVFSVSIAPGTHCSQASILSASAADPPIFKRIAAMPWTICSSVSLCDSPVHETACTSCRSRAVPSCDAAWAIPHSGDMTTFVTDFVGTAHNRCCFSRLISNIASFHGS